MEILYLCRLMRSFLVYFLLLGFVFSPLSGLRCQTPIIYNVNNLPQGFELLLRRQFPLPDVYEAESLLNLVHVSLVDSMVEKKFERLRFPLSPLLQAIGYRWERLNEQKQRFIGTYSRHMKMYDGFAHEFDMNIFLVPHLDQYILAEAEALDLTLRRGRNFDEVKADTVSFPCPPELRYNGKCIGVECEVTPSEAAREALPGTLLPIHSGTHNVQDHVAFGTETPSVAVYGTWCADCNHNCRPEIHPIELMWWMGPAEKGTQVWNIVSFADVSRRFRNWSQSPLQATIDLPLVLEKDHPVNVYFEPVIMDGDTTFPGPLNCNTFVFETGGEDGEGLPPRVLSLFTPFDQFPKGFEAELIVSEMPRPESPGYGYLRIRMNLLSEWGARVRVTRK